MILVCGCCIARLSYALVGASRYEDNSEIDQGI